MPPVREQVTSGTTLVPRSLLAKLDAWRRRVTRPSPSVVETEDRRRASMVIAVAYVMTWILSLSTVISLCTTILFPDPDISLGYGGTIVIAVAALAFFVGLRLARRERFERGAWVTIVTIDLFLLSLGLLFVERGVVLAIGYAAPVAAATLFLRAKGTILVFFMSGVLGTAHLFITRATLVDSGFLVGITMTVTTLSVVIAVLRENDLAEVSQLREAERARSERIHSELDVARRVQLAMMPSEITSVDGLDIAVFSEPAYEASGDFYDVFPVDPTHGGDEALGIVVCDVAGKGVASALVMSAARVALRAEAERTTSLAGVLAKVNETLSASLPPELFVTLCFAVFEPASATLRWTSAGNPHPLHWRSRDRSFGELECFGMPLGLMPGSTYEEYSVRLEPGDSVMIFTDGLVEALSVDRTMFGFQRVEDDFALHAGSIDGAAAQLDAALASMRAFVGDALLEDDVTVVTLAIPESIDLAEVTSTMAATSIARATIES